MERIFMINEKQWKTISLLAKTVYAKERERDLLLAIVQVSGIALEAHFYKREDNATGKHEVQPEATVYTCKFEDNTKTVSFKKQNTRLPLYKESLIISYLLVDDDLQKYSTTCADVPV